MSWRVTLSYRRAVPVKRGIRNEEYAETHGPFETQHEADDFRRRATAGTGWAPAGAFDLDVSDAIEVFDNRRSVDL